MFWLLKIFVHRRKKKHCSDVKEKLDAQTNKQEDHASKKQKVSESHNKDMENNKGNAERNEDSPVTPSMKKYVRWKL